MATRLHDAPSSMPAPADVRVFVVLLGALAWGACNDEGERRRDAPPAPTDDAPRVASLPPVDAKRPAAPNVLLVAVDTLRADRLSHYGYERDTASGLDAFAKHATRFTRAYAPAAWTSPSVASLFTGMFPSRHGVERLGQSLPAKWRTLAQELRSHGYAAVGQSFNHVITVKTKFHRGFAVFGNYPARPGSYGDMSEMVQRAGVWFDYGPQPFFMYLQPMNVHGPYRVPHNDAKRLLGRRPKPLFKFHGGIATQILGGQLELRREFSAEHLASLNEQYDTAVRYTMDQLGVLLKHMQKRKLYDDTMIVVTADHGEELFDHGGFSHGHTLYEEVVRVPLYVKLPGQREGGTSDDWVSLVDVYPSILEAVGIKPSTELDGRSFVGRMQGRGEPPEEKMFFVSTLKKAMIGRALSWRGYKLVQVDKNYEGVQHEVRLYDLEKDPKELRDVSDEHPDLVDAHGAEIQRLLGQYSKGKGRSKGGLDDDELRGLKALGYAQ